MKILRKKLSTDFWFLTLFFSLFWLRKTDRSANMMGKYSVCRIWWDFFQVNWWMKRSIFGDVWWYGHKQGEHEAAPTEFCIFDLQLVYLSKIYLSECSNWYGTWASFGRHSTIESIWQMTHFTVIGVFLMLSLVPWHLTQW